MPQDAVTGAFGFTGRAIAERLLADGRAVLTLSRRPGQSDDPLTGRVEVVALDIGRPDRLIAAMHGVHTLYNTYWLRFPRGGQTFDRAIAESAVIIGAAREAGVERLVHVSVVGADLDAPTPYVRAKARLEETVRSAGLDWSIVRPTLTFGTDDILVNNLAWTLRRLPLVGMPGDGRYPIQPVHVADVARICVEVAGEPTGTIADAAGPETLTYHEMVALVRTAIGSRSRVVSMPAPLILAAARLLGLVVGDVVLTADEIRELTSGLLASAEPPRGSIRFSRWIAENRDRLGRRWSSELARNYTIRPNRA